jgi:PAS domain S-box-containing protein
VWWSDTSRIPLRDGEGRVVGVLCTFQDITDRRRTEEALRESERRFRTLVENSLAGILIVQEGEVLYLNPEARRLCGELAPRLRLENLAAAPAEDRRRLAELAARPPGEGPWELELRLARSGQAGGYRWVHCRANRMEHQGREALLLLLLDISRARELEHMLRVQDKMASLGRVAAGIAHEIRNPLSGVTMYLSALEGLAEADCTPEEVRRIAGRIRRAAGRIEAVMKRVLDFSRPAAPRLAWVSVNRVIREVIELSQVTLRKSRVEVTTDLAPELPLCHADAQLLEQVLMNLVTNAVQALAEAEGPRRIEIASGLSGGSVVIRVADSGPGVPPEAGERIFDPFFTIKKDGSGIGLALSQRIVSDHGGRLTAGVSRWGGAEFTIEMPTTFYWGYDSHG